MRQRITINWSVSSYFGWGVYGLNLALQWANDPDIELMSCIPIAPDDLYIDPIQRRALAPFLGVSKALEKILPPLGTRIQLECPVLSDVYLGPERFEYSISGSPTIGLVFFDTTQLTQDALHSTRRCGVGLDKALR